MRIKPEQLAQQLKRELLPVYIVSGDEPLLVLETEDSIRVAAREQQYSEREVLEVDARFNWQQFTHIMGNLSLFSVRRIIELRFASKPDAAAQKVLLDYASHRPVDIVLLIRCARLDGSSQKAKWFVALDAMGGSLILYPPDRTQLPQWIMQRAKKNHITLTPEAAQWLADHNEGHLLAIAQELARLPLLFEHDSINIDQIQSVAGSSARYTVYDWIDAVLLGDIERVVRIWHGLKEEAEEPVLMNWALQREIRVLGQLVGARHSGASVEAALSQAGVWEKRKPLYKRAMLKLNMKRLQQLVNMTVEIDRAIKGNLKESPWNALLRTGLALAGQRLLPLSAQAQI